MNTDQKRRTIGMRMCMKYHSYVASSDEVQCPTCAQIAALTAELAAEKQRADKLETELAEEMEVHGITQLDRNNLLALSNRLRAALKVVEWGSGFGCECCHKSKSKGHAPDCIVGLAMGGAVE